MHTYIYNGATLGVMVALGAAGTTMGTSGVTLGADGIILGADGIMLGMGGNTIFASCTTLGTGVR